MTANRRQLRWRRLTQRLATVFDRITRHSPEGLAFKERADAAGWMQTVREREEGTYDWTNDEPVE